MKPTAAAERRRIAIAGATGRMGHMLIEAVLASDDCVLAGALDRHLLESIFDWVKRDWPFERVFVANHKENVRGAELLTALGLKVAGPESSEKDATLYLWEKR